MTAAEDTPTPRKKAATKKAAAALEAEPAVLHVVASAKSKPTPKPGAPDFDWRTEYPGEDDVFVFTAASGRTIGMVKLTPARKPKPGVLRRLHREGGMSVMWYFVELASSPAALRVQEELDEEEYTTLLRAWAEFAGIELSE